VNLKITIITVTLNNSSNLDKTIASVLNQNYSNIEYIIIDGGSIDDTFEIIKKYEKYSFKFVSEKDNGIYDAMNKGILLATGDVINFLNAGDMFYDNNVLCSVADQYDKYLMIGILYGRSEFFSDIERILYIKGQEVQLSALWKKMPACHQSMFFRKELFTKFGLYDLKFRIASDFELFLRFVNLMPKDGYLLVYTNEILSKIELYGINSKNYIHTWLETKQASQIYYACTLKSNFYYNIMFIKSYFLIFLSRLNILKYYRRLKYNYLKK